MANGNGNLMDDFEEAFQHCLHVLTRQDPSSDDVIKLEVEQTTMNFINLARQLDVFFLQKRFLLCTLKPELLLTEENNDLKLELIRKEELIKKHSDKLESWKKLLSEQPKTMPTVVPVPPGGNMGMNPGVGMPPQQMNPNMVGPGMQSPMQMQHQMQMQQQQQQQQHHHQHAAAVAQQRMLMSQQQSLFMAHSGGGAPGGGPLSYLEKTTDQMYPSGGDARR